MASNLKQSFKNNITFYENEDNMLPPADINNFEPFNHLTLKQSSIPITYFAHKNKIPT